MVFANKFRILWAFLKDLSKAFALLGCLQQSLYLDVKDSNYHGDILSPFSGLFD
jgi:hypothetical protein